MSTRGQKHDGQPGWHELQDRETPSGRSLGSVQRGRYPLSSDILQFSATRTQQIRVSQEYDKPFQVY